jgi:hypothetical protein
MVLNFLWRAAINVLARLAERATRSSTPPRGCGRPAHHFEAGAGTADFSASRRSSRTAIAALEEAELGRFGIDADVVVRQMGW